MKFSERRVPGYQRVLLAEDPAAGYRGIIAVHSTVLGPAVGGTRLWRYADQEEGFRDALRLARGMTYKNALAALPFGGGKSVILESGEIADREQLFRAHGRAIESLGGSYVTAEDVGTGPADMEFIRQETNYVGGLAARSGDPSPHTARGVFRAMQAASRHHWNSDSLAGKTVTIQGCGHVGESLARQLHLAGARLVVSDVDRDRAQKLAREVQAEAVDPDQIYSVAADVFAPCALGGVLTDRTIPQFRVQIVCGAANNQLQESRHGDALRNRNILYIPDYAANAGGVINGCCRELLGWSLEQTLEKIEAIYDTVADILQMSARQDLPPHLSADQLAEKRLADRSRGQSGANPLLQNAQ